MSNNKQPTSNPTYKIIMVGDASVGKSTFINQLVGKNYNEVTVGFTTNKIQVTIDNRKFTLVLWDSSAQQIQSLPVAYMKSTLGVLLIFSLTEQKSFQSLKKWLKLISKCEDKADGVQKVQLLTVVILGNKCDLQEERMVKRQEAQQFANERFMEYLEVSAKLGNNCQKAVELLVQKMDQQCKLEASKVTKLKDYLVPLQKEPQKKGYCSVF